MKNYPEHLEAMWQKAIAPRDANAPKVISTFAGGGGSLTGYLMAGYDDILAVEWDNNAVETLRLNYPHLDIYHGDIAKLTVDEVLRRTGLQVGQLDILDGSPPCQGFSTAGKRMMDDPRNQLFREYVRLLRGLKPKAFVMENVSGMVKGKMKLVFVEILKELKDSGYKVSARLLNAKYFHVPQSRERMIFIGVRDDLGIEPSHPRAESGEIGAIRIDEREATYSDVRYGDQIVKKDKPVNTIARLQRHFWDRNHELGEKSYQACGSFPSSYRFIGSFQDKKNRIGNSVPPLFMEAIARHIKHNILNITPELIPHPHVG